MTWSVHTHTLGHSSPKKSYKRWPQIAYHPSLNQLPTHISDYHTSYISNLCQPSLKQGLHCHHMYDLWFYLSYSVLTLLLIVTYSLLVCISLPSQLCGLWPLFPWLELLFGLGFCCNSECTHFTNLVWTPPSFVIFSHASCGLHFWRKLPTELLCLSLKL